MTKLIDKEIDKHINLLAKIGIEGNDLLGWYIYPSNVKELDVAIKTLANLELLAEKINKKLNVSISKTKINQLKEV
jgi:hypothetical protein